MVRYVRVLKIEKRYEPARGALLIKTMIDTNNFYSSLNLRGPDVDAENVNLICM